MNKRIIAFVFMAITAALLCCGCESTKEKAAEYTLEAGKRIVLYTDDTCEYIETSTHDYSPIPLVNSNEYEPVIGHVTFTGTLTYCGEYNIDSNGIYTVEFDELIKTYQVVHDLNKEEQTMFFNNEFRPRVLSLLNTQERNVPAIADKHFEIFRGNGSITEKIKQETMTFELNESGLVSKLERHSPFDFIIPMHSESYEYKEFIYSYDDDGSLVSYKKAFGSTNSQGNDNEERIYTEYNIHGDAISGTNSDSGYEYTYYEDGTIESKIKTKNGIVRSKETFYPNGVSKERYSYFIDGKLREYYKYSDNGSMLEHITYSFSPESEHYCEYYDDGNLKRSTYITYDASRKKTTTVKNYTYKVERYSNNVVRSAETYVNGVIHSRNEYYESGVTKTKEDYYNGELREVKRYSPDGICIEDISGNINGPSFYIRKYDPITGYITEKIYKDSQDAEVITEKYFESEYNSKKKTTTMKFYNYEDDTRYLFRTVVLDKNSSIIQEEEYEYSERMPPYETVSMTFRFTVIDSKTYTFGLDSGKVSFTQKSVITADGIEISCPVKN